MGKKAPDDALEGEVLTAEEEDLLRQAMTTQEHSAAILPMYYSRALIALQEADRLDECQDYIHKAEMISVYAKQAKDDRMEVMAKRINARAWRRLGELLHALPSQPGKGAGRQMVADQHAASLLNVMTTEHQFCADLAKKVGLAEGTTKRVLTPLVSAGYLESASSDYGGYRLAPGVAPANITPEELKQVFTPSDEEKAARRTGTTDAIPREQTRAGQAEAQGLSKGEQHKAMAIAEIPEDFFTDLVESDRSASGKQLLDLRRDLKGADSPAYTTGPGSMRRVIEREVKEFRIFTESTPVRSASLLFASEASAMRVKLKNLIIFCDKFAAALRART